MADTVNNAPPTKSAEDIEKELTVSKFAGQQVRTLVILGGGMLVGGGLAYAATKWKGLKDLVTKQKWFKAYANHAVGEMTYVGDELKKIASDKDVQNFATVNITTAGVLAGSIVGGMMSDYEHWRKIKGEQLGVEKINHDVDTVMQSRVKFEDTLNQQRETIQEMRQRLEGEKKGTIAEKILADKDKAPTERTAP